MKKIVFLLSIIVYANLSFGQERFSFNQGTTLQAEYLTKVKYDLVRGKMIIPVAIRGKQYRFLFDTGAPTAVSEKLSEELRLATIISLPIKDQSGKVDSMMVAQLDSLDINGVTFLHTPILIIHQPLIFDCLQIDGIIGSNMLRNALVQLSHPDKTITLTTEAVHLKLNPDHAAELFLNPVQSTPYVWINIKGKKGGREQVLFDSGMDNFYDLTMNHYELFKKRKIFTVSAKSTGSNTLGIHGVADAALQYKLLLPELSLNGTVFKNISLTTTGDNNSRIGTKVLEHGLVTLDYKHKKFYYEPFQQGNIDLATKDFPVGFTILDNTLRIGIIWDESLKTKLALGDQVLRIDDEEYEHQDICKMITTEPYYRDKDKINLQVRDASGVVKSIVLERK